MARRKKLRLGKIYAAAVVCIAVLFIFGCASLQGSAGGGKETLIYEEGFEYSDGGWMPRGPASLKLADDIIHSGTKSLYISGRTKTWNGAIRAFVNLKPGQSYRISFWVYVAEGSDSQGMSLSVQQNVEGQGETYSTIGADRVPLGTWTKIEGELTVPRSRFETVTSIYFESSYKSDDATQPADLFSFYVDDIAIVRLPPAPPPAVEHDIPDLTTILPEVPLGAAINHSYFNSDNIHHGLLRHFNAYVYGNEMKQDAIQPAEGRFNFAKADALMDYAAKNGKKVRGHVLVWHQQVPSWLFQGSGPNGLATKEELYARMENHIKTVVSRYKGKVDSWDVVNEVIGDDGSLRDSKYFQIVGSHEYIVKAFRWAHEADPDAKLFINDFGVEGSGAKQEGYFKLVSDLLAEGVPIHGVGLQCHISIGWPTVGDLRSVIRRFAGLGLKVQVTEFDMSIYANSGEAKKRADREVLLAQAFKYQSLFTMFREEARSGNLDMVVMWGIADDDTWLNNHPVTGRTDYPLFFGKDLRAKPAYWVMVNPENLPIQIKKIDASRSDTALNNIQLPFWRLVSPRAVSDIKGNSYGWFKAAWTADRIVVQVRVEDSSKDDGDGVTVFIEPQNQKQEERSPEAFSMDFSRSSAVQDDSGGYTLLADIPFTGKTDQKIGFDIRIHDNGNLRSWNDFNNSQDKASINYGTINLRTLPPVTAAKRGTARIDGRADEWESVVPVPIAVKTEGYAEEGSQFRLLWDDKYLYVLVEVVDSVLNDASTVVHEQDSVEVFLDQNNGKTTAYESDDGQYRINFKNVVSYNGGDSEGFRSRTRVYSGGYAVEMALPLYAVQPQPGTLMGFDVQINNADASGTRASIRNWVNDTNMGYQDTSGFGILLLE
jgi:endo-1,4-beta-xylanase